MQYICALVKITNPCFPAMYFLEQDSDYLFEFYDSGRIQISRDDAPKRGWFYL